MSDTTPRSTSKALSYFSTLVCAQVGRPDCPEERSQKVCGIYVLTDGDCSLDCPKLHPRDVAGHLALKKAQEYKGMRNPQCTVHDLLTGSGLTLAFPVAVCLKGDSCFHKAACWFSHAKDVRELATPPVIRQHELEHPGIILESAPILNFSYAPPKSSSPPTSETPPSEITTQNANVTEPIKKPEAIQTPMPNTSNETDADSSLSDWFSAFCMHLDSTISADETSSRGREGMLNRLDRPTAFRSVVICENAGKKNDRDAGGDVPR